METASQKDPGLVVGTQVQIITVAVEQMHGMIKEIFSLSQVLHVAVVVRKHKIIVNADKLIAVNT